MQQSIELKTNIFEKISLNTVRIIVFFIAVLSTFYILYNVSYPGYEYLYLLPLVYGVVFTIFISPVLFKNSNIFLAVFTSVTFTRYVILPTMIVFSNLYGGRSAVPPLDKSIELGIFLMLYELVIISMIIFFLYRNYNPQIKSNRIELPNSYFIYILFLGATFILTIFNPSVINSFYFMVPPDNLQGLEQESLINSLTLYCLVISKYIIYLLLMALTYKRYSITKNKIYIILSFIITLLNISVIFGGNRADFIITSIVSFLLFNKLYPKQGKKASILIIILIIMIVSSINSYRDNTTHTQGANPLQDFTNTLQIYLGGPYNVGISLETANLNPEGRDMFHLGYDLLRPAIGPNILLKNVDFKMSSDYFNERIFFSDHKSQIIPIIGQGYFFFGFLLSPIILVLFVLFARLLLYFRQKISRIELYFFLTIPIARIGLAMGQNGSILMNDTSFFLGLSLLIYFLNNKIVLIK